MTFSLEERDFKGYGEITPDPKWPKGAKIAISFVVNYEEGGENTVLNQDKGSEVFLNETPGGQSRIGIRDINMETQYEYGSRVGVWRILRAFKKHSYPFTCYAVGRAVEKNPEAIKAMVEAGHEIASHNYRWIDYQTLDESTEREHIRATIKAIKDASGKPPVGWYTGRISTESRRIVWEEFKSLGLPLLYDCDAYNDDLPPGFGGPDAFLTYLKNTFDVLYREGHDGHAKMMNIGLHCRLVGKPGRVAALEKFLEYISGFPDVWVCTREQIANHWRKTHPFSK
ncbi:chitin deacetylase cda1 [Globomyces sp. JEL0801]|nr:chitin deacetylase cda1 [Globomyces sp. JEL0801]